MGSKSEQPAARLGDIGSNHGPWPPTPIIAGSGNVLINSIRAARKGDAVLLHVIPNNPPHPRSIKEGSNSVLINSIPAARVSDAISCGGKVATGSGNVMIGDTPKLLAHEKLEIPPIVFPSQAGKQGKGLIAEPQNDSSLSASEPVMYTPDPPTPSLTPENQAFIDQNAQTIVRKAQQLDRNEPANTDITDLAEAMMAAATALDGGGGPVLAKTIDEALGRLENARRVIEHAKANGDSLPSSPFTLEEKQAIVANGLEENILVRVIKRDHAEDDGKIARASNGKQVYFTAPLSQVEHGDSQAKELLNAFGTHYDPAAKYTLLVMDRQKLADLGDTESIIPTFENLNTMIADNPNIGVDADVARQVLNSEFAPKYEKISKAAEASGVDLSDASDAKQLAVKMGFSSEEAELLQKRHQIAKDISAWDIFQGNGMTRDTNFTHPVDGPVEVFTFDRKPLDLGDLESQGALTRLELN
ncbi:MAG: PAAR domain-containing protein [Cellvibrionaceae bacterium]